jgi:hypothetical protein
MDSKTGLKLEPGAIEAAVEEHVSLALGKLAEAGILE